MLQASSRDLRQSSCFGQGGLDPSEDAGLPAWRQLQTEEADGQDKEDVERESLQNFEAYHRSKNPYEWN
jgi:hypothetical protein